MMIQQLAKCKLCGEPMPPGEEMFARHGHSGPCPEPKNPDVAVVAQARAEALLGEGRTIAQILAAKCEICGSPTEFDDGLCDNHAHLSLLAMRQTVGELQRELAEEVLWADSHVSRLERERAELQATIEKLTEELESRTRDAEACFRYQLQLTQEIKRLFALLAEEQQNTIAKQKESR